VVTAVASSSMVSLIFSWASDIVSLLESQTFLTTPWLEIHLLNDPIVIEQDHVSVGEGEVSLDPQSPVTLHSLNDEPAP
jgi:hypothetical protein